MAKARSGIVAATVDIGTSKIVCFVARVDGAGLRDRHPGHQPAQGLRSGNIGCGGGDPGDILGRRRRREMCGETVRG